jgi:hypothetical protein
MQGMQPGVLPEVPLEVPILRGEEMTECMFCKAEADIVPIQLRSGAKPTFAPICDECIAGIKGWSNKKEIANKLGVMLDTMRTLEGGKR